MPQAAEGIPRPLVLVLGVTLCLYGCAALPLAAVGGAVLGSGAGAVVKTGTEYTMTGVARRTFTVPAKAVRAAVLEAFDRAGVAVPAHTDADDEDHIIGTLEGRTVEARLTSFSSSLTGMTLVVKRNALVKDRATSSELLEQVEQVLAENPTFARRLHRPATDAAASSAVH